MSKPYSQAGEKGTDTNQASEDGDLRDILSKVLCEGQNQIHDLLGGTATPEEVTDRMYASLDYWQPRAESILRTEKLKLLAEVRERAIPNPTTPAGENELVPLDELAKLEAEL